MTKPEKKDFNELISKSKSVEEVAEKMGVDISPEACSALMAEIEGRIQERVKSEKRNGSGEDVFEERKEKEEAGEVVDEPTSVEKEAEVDGWEVGVGQAGSETGFGSQDQTAAASESATAPAPAPASTVSETIKA
jgi:tRNA-dihydrouridine synthase 2